MDPGDPPETPVIAEIVPFRTVAGDTVHISGETFGDTPGVVEFLSPESAVLAIGMNVSWSEDEIVVLVPAGAHASGLIAVRVGEAASDPLAFERAPRVISYQNDLLPLFQTYFCDSCHGGSGNLYVVPHALLMRGDSDHGPVVIPRRSAESHFRDRLLATTKFLRMPEGGAPSYLSDEEVLLISDWIDQGARDN